MVTCSRKPKSLDDEGKDVHRQDERWCSGGWQGPGREGHGGKAKIADLDPKSHGKPLKVLSRE